ncbi:FG-GAP-like repeat-containing protein [Parafilimonas terrae]|uniref:FG-GAP repeat-containing protein n=1 Tax=Parafilimonas terrae TaxID=1465490 RepID=A0A1I5RT96_9BACT|nr:FG-GAP-like repeat-containing protein [Parafilimonas terrae]SFP61713.1 FG-GAP repeat-containing protein [Parafilimonas terrae]
MRIVFLSCWLLLAFSFCNKQKTLFSEIPPTKSGISFSNIITENDSINILDYEYVYNGGGVGVGDFNRDGLPDIYFTGSMVSNELYLNEGGLKFRNVTQASNTAGEGKWCNGVSVIDINNDGWPDIFVSATRNSNANDRRSILYMNQGLNKEGIPVFKNEAADYGLDDTSYSTSASFFDYDNDGDLDMFSLVAGKLQGNKNPGGYSYNLNDTSSLNISRLFQNNWDENKQHSYFTDVSKIAGINKSGYGLGINITDINHDGWKDILVSNDYLSGDQLWINNGDGTFSERSKEYFKHTSFSAMGNDVADINNDGLPDIIELDMSPADNYRRKLMMSPNNYQNVLSFERFNYQYQYGHNTLQLNCGNAPGENDSVKKPVFSDIAYFSGIDRTDWSWAPLVADFDNDSYRDIIITNGFPKDLSDQDFIAFRNKLSSVASDDMLIEQMPAAKLKNYAFSNNHNLTFSDVTEAWGIKTPTFSNGAVYVDLDNDGDLDVVTNNINGPASVYRNNLRQQSKAASNYINIKFNGDNKNINGLGALVSIYYNRNKSQFWENTPYRGYLSTVQDVAHFGLDSVTAVDSIVIIWPDHTKQVIKNVKANQTITADKKDAIIQYIFKNHTIDSTALFTNVTTSVNVHYIQSEKDFIDFNIQKLLPHKFSEFGPGMAAGDINGDGLDDLITGGSFYYTGQKFLQQKDGKFLQKDLIGNTINKNAEDEGLLLFDADGDGDLDLYIASGGYETEPGSPAYQDRFYINDGKGNFALDSNALPKNFTSKFCVRAADYDKDGDLDLFVSGRVDPWNYPKPVSSFIFRNDTKNGTVRFVDVTKSVAPSLINIGLTCDAIFSDFNNDGWPDIILAGEWMPITFLQNEKGIFKNVTVTSGISNNIGWWNTIAGGDFDNDGDIDYIAGNTGLNTFYKPSEKYPVSIYAKDFNDDENYDAILSVYLLNNSTEKKMQEFPACSRDDMIRQINTLRKKYNTYKSYATATIDSVLNEEDKKDALIYRANNFASCFIKNDGNGKFTMEQLPAIAQISTLCGMSVEDYDGDGNLDVVINGNNYGIEVSTGRSDALNGLMLKGDGKGNFMAVSILQSGIYIPGNGKSITALKNQKNECLLAASENRGPMRVFYLRNSAICLPARQDEQYAVIKTKDNKSRRQEIYYGASYLSQSSRFILANSSTASICFYNSKGEARLIKY